MRVTQGAHSRTSQPNPGTRFAPTQQIPSHTGGVISRLPTKATPQAKAGLLLCPSTLKPQVSERPRRRSDGPKERNSGGWERKLTRTPKKNRAPADANNHKRH